MDLCLYIFSGTFETYVLYLVPERKIDRFSKFKKGEDFNRRNTLAYFEDWNLSLTPKLGEIAVCVQALTGYFLFMFAVSAR